MPRSIQFSCDDIAMTTRAHLSIELLPATPPALRVRRPRGRDTRTFGSVLTTIGACEGLRDGTERARGGGGRLEPRCWRVLAASRYLTEACGVHVKYLRGIAQNCAAAD